VSWNISVSDDNTSDMVTLHRSTAHEENVSMSIMIHKLRHVQWATVYVHTICYTEWALHQVHYTVMITHSGW